MNFFYKTAQHYKFYLYHKAFDNKFEQKYINFLYFVTKTLIHKKNQSSMTDFYNYFYSSTSVSRPESVN